MACSLSSLPRASLSLAGANRTVPLADIPQTKILQANEFRPGVAKLTAMVGRRDLSHRSKVILQHRTRVRHRLTLNQMLFTCNPETGIMSEVLELIDTELDVVCGGSFNVGNIVEQSNTATQVGLALGGHQFHHRR
jgi:hypothetical protein